MRTTSSAKSPPQHFFLPILTPYFSQSFTISLMNQLNKIGDNGQPWRTPLLIGNSFDNIEANRARVLDEVYKLQRKSKHLPRTP